MFYRDGIEPNLFSLCTKLINWVKEKKLKREKHFEIIHARCAQANMVRQKVGNKEIARKKRNVVGG
jgi:hypothetical protein